MIASQQGTIDFISIEVAAHSYLFYPHDPGLTSDEFYEFFGAVRWSERRRQRSPTGVLFSHNHLHDLESLWWVAVWTAFYNDFLERDSSHDRPSPSLEDAKEKLSLAGTIFPHALQSTTRRDNFQGLTDFAETYANLSDNKETFCSDLDFLRKNLIKQYRVVETGYPKSVDPKLSGDGIYDRFAKIFPSLGTKYTGFTLAPIKEIDEQPLQAESKKHSRSESTADAVAPGSQKTPRT